MAKKTKAITDAEWVDLVLQFGYQSRCIGGDRSDRYGMRNIEQAFYGARLPNGSIQALVQFRSDTYEYRGTTNVHRDGTMVQSLTVPRGDVMQWAKTNYPDAEIVVLRMRSEFTTDKRQKQVYLSDYYRPVKGDWSLIVNVEEGDFGTVTAPKWSYNSLSGTEYKVTTCDITKEMIV